MPDYYRTHYAQYHDKTFHIDSAGFLSLFDSRLRPGADPLNALKKGQNALVYLSLKDGEGVFNHTHDRTYHLWQDRDIRSVCAGLGLKVLDVSRSESARGTDATWLGYVMVMEQ